MMSMKKYFLLFVLLALLLTFAACAPAPKKPTAPPPEKKPPAAPPKPEEKIKILSLAEIAEKIRKGEIDVGKEYGMELGKRYHNIHVNVLGLKCKTCHVAKKYAPDYIYQRKYKVPVRGAPGVVDRAVCLGCHKKGGIARELYGTAAESYGTPVR